MGLDTRNLQFNGEEFTGESRNIDTIMQAVYDHKNGNVFLISIPRDTGVTVTEECANQNQYKRSIHFLYDLGESGDCSGGGVGLMRKYVADITGFENHYFAIISLDAFTDIVDAIGDTNELGQKGLYMDIPKNTYELYPLDRGGYESIFFPEGYQFLTSERVLKYARSRQYSSDFDRARRQQEVVDALKNKIISSDTLLDPIKMLNLYNSFKSNALFSEISISEIKAGISLATNFDQENIYHIVADDSLGGKDNYLTRPVTSGGKHRRTGYYLTPIDYIELDDDFQNVRNYIKGIVKYRNVYEESAKIYVYATSTSGVNNIEKLNSNYADLKSKNLPVALNESKFTQSLKQGGDIELYDFSGSKPETIKILEEALGVTAVSKENAGFTPLNKEEITIIVKTN
jgi:anionic cell wall polymer biosynthesis LytR-Cps2A-Psr (LCP) family protein